MKPQIGWRHVRQLVPLVLAAILAGGCGSSRGPERVPVSEYKPRSGEEQDADAQEATRELRTGRLGELKMRVDEAISSNRLDESARLVEQMADAGPTHPESWVALAGCLGFEISPRAGDPATRYRYAIRGAELLLEGMDRIGRHPELCFRLGFYLEQRFGRLPDGRELHEPFQNDHRFHQRLNQLVTLDSAVGPEGAPDALLVAGLLHELVENDLDVHGVPGDWITVPWIPLLYSFSWQDRMEFARAAQRESCTREYSREAWRTAETALTAYAEREFTDTVLGIRFRMNDLVRDGNDQPALVRRPNFTDDRTMTDEELITWVERYQSVVDYQYWKQRAAVEQTVELLEAWELLRSAREFTEQIQQQEQLDTDAMANGVERLRRASSIWQGIYERHPFYSEDESLTEILESLRQAQRTLEVEAPPTAETSEQSSS
jgi:hypothetical protein